jgi:hypothetical protein
MNDHAALVRNLVLWAVPFAIVAAALAYETDWGRAVDPAPDPTKSGSVPPVTVSLLPEYRIAGGPDARKETVDRVLFNPTRRPAPPAVQTAGAGAGSMSKGLYALTGTSMTSGVATAFLREVKGGKSHTVRRGDSLNGIVVADVKTDSVRLKQGDDVEDLQLKIATGPKTTIQVAAPVAAGQPRAPGAGGSGAAEANARAAQPGTNAPAPIANPPAANAPARASGTMSVSEILAERRRAARAAAAAANQGGGAAPRSR